ncbi:hypothetical protein BD408DRAFT_412221 [Parasitella parasitica]|nr:hypothetical protein BD408DRAFT_412221 [Parasitella parasitica]
MASGVAVNDECLNNYGSLKMGQNYKYIIFKLSEDNSEIIVEKSVKTGDYEEFLNCLPEVEPRYAVYDFDFQTDDGLRNKIVFYSWIPDTAKVRQKMLYAASKDALRKRLEGLAVEIQGTDASEVAYETVLEKANSK